MYHGRINDLFAGLEQRREAVSTHDLRDALDAVVAGRLPPAHDSGRGVFHFHEASCCCLICNPRGKFVVELSALPIFV